MYLNSSVTLLRGPFGGGLRLSIHLMHISVDIGRIANYGEDNGQGYVLQFFSGELTIKGLLL